MGKFLFIYFLMFTIAVTAQQTVVSGTVSDGKTGELLPFVRVSFKDSKIGTFTDSVGHYFISTYYATDSLQVFMSGYKSQTVGVIKDKEQQIDFKLEIEIEELEDVVIRPPDEYPSTTLHKRVIANKNINNKEKLASYSYESYNKIQIDLNNIGEKFLNGSVMQRLDIVKDYIDSNENGKALLPVLLSETISEFDFKNNPKKRRETIIATRVSGMDNPQFNQFLGEMYLDINIYDNYINLFARAFVSPVANIARTYYRFYLEDSMFIDNQWCYKLRFKPKRTGDATFEGEMWIHDTTYAVKQFKANISPDMNINYVQNLYLEHHFDQVEKEVWMLTQERMLIDLKLSEKSKLYGFVGRKNALRKNFKINEKLPESVFKTDNSITVLDSAKLRDDAYWNKHRYIPLAEKEKDIDRMIDTLNKTPFFKTIKLLSYTLASGYYPIGKLEVGSVHSLIALNPVEQFRTGFALRTSNEFSKRIELGGRLYYGFGDKEFKYGLKTRYNILTKKRGLLTTYINHDLEQIGVSPTAPTQGSTFSSLLRTAPLDKLTLVTRIGSNYEADLKKDFMLTTGFEWSEFLPKGKATYEKVNSLGQIERLSEIRTMEFSSKLRWAKNEEFIAGAFDRISVGSKFPILTLSATIGAKGIFGSSYNYQKLNLDIEHKHTLGILGYLKYGAYFGGIFGQAPYPLLKVHEGSQSYWLNTTTFNRMSFFEFISDRYIGGYAEQHWEGLLFDRIPLIKKLNWRLVSSVQAVYGAIEKKQSQALLLPEFTKSFGSIPYVECSVGIENIFKIIRIDAVYRATHLYPGISPISIRGRWAIII